MTFGESLRYELIQITKINEKVFPIVAPKDTIGPFLVYKRENAEFKKTLSGTSDKCHAVYELVIITNNYAEKEEIEEEVKDKLLSFLFRSIGNGGPIIQNVRVDFLGEAYEFEPDLLSSRIKLEVDF